MPSLLWVTDPHLTHMKPDARAKAIERLRERQADVLVVTGDIAEAPTLDDALAELRTVAPAFYYVLGNHDCYHGTVAGTRARQGKGWLGSTGVVRLSETTCLIGEDGWYDGRNGDYFGRGAAWHLADFDLIAEFRGARPMVRLQVMRHLADEAAERARHLLESVGGYKHVYFATHVAPFEEAAWHKGAPSSPDAQPFFSSRVMGEMIIETVRSFSIPRLTVLCGHSHSAGYCVPWGSKAAPHVDVYTGQADYGQVLIAGEFQVEG